MQEQNGKTQIEEVLEIVSFVKDHAATQEGLDNLEKKLSNRIDSLETKVDSLATRMVTKEYLDDKLADLRGDLVVLTRKEDGKLRLLVEKLHQRQILSDADKQEIFKMEPFPQLSL